MAEREMTEMGGEKEGEKLFLRYSCLRFGSAGLPRKVLLGEVRPSRLVLVSLPTARGSGGFPQYRLPFLITMSTCGFSASSFPLGREDPWDTAAPAY